MIAHNAPETKQPQVARMTVTPTMAANWLEHANSRNRPVSQAAVARYARDMKGGRWQLTHQGIAFDPNGVLLDGQQRLWAVLEADVPVEMYVWLNVPNDTLMIIDGGRPRNLADHLRLGGGLGEVTNQHLSTLRAMVGHGVDDKPITAGEAHVLIQRHWDAIDYAVQQLPRMARVKGVSTGPTRAVIARAFYSAAHDRLEEFCAVLRTSLARGEMDEMVIMLRDYLRLATNGSRSSCQERYLKTQRVLMAYLRGEKLPKLYAATKELFPLPEETR